LIEVRRDRFALLSSSRYCGCNGDSSASEADEGQPDIHHARSPLLLLRLRHRAADSVANSRHLMSFPRQAYSGCSRSEKMARAARVLLLAAGVKVPPSPSVEPKGENSHGTRNVRFTLESGHVQRRSRCPLWARRRHWHCKNWSAPVEARPGAALPMRAT